MSYINYNENTVYLTHGTIIVNDEETSIIKCEIKKELIKEIIIPLSYIERIFAFFVKKKEKIKREIVQRNMVKLYFADSQIAYKWWKSHFTYQTAAKELENENSYKLDFSIKNGDKKILYGFGCFISYVDIQNKTIDMTIDKMEIIHE